MRSRCNSTAGSGDGAVEISAFVADAINVRRFDERMPGNARFVPAQIVNQDEDDIGAGWFILAKLRHTKRNESQQEKGG
jgi:hypothetical protein